MIPRNPRALWNAGYSVTMIAQILTRSAGHDVSVGDVCRELWRDGITVQIPANRQQRTLNALKGIEGKRLTYRRSRLRAN